MSCKCGARTYDGHLKKLKQSKVPAHVYRDNK
jgi:hypothetical protein